MQSALPFIPTLPARADVSAWLLVRAIRLAMAGTSGLAFRLQRLGRGLASLQRQIESLTNRAPLPSGPRGGKQQDGRAGSVRYKVLYLNSFGHSVEEIARQVGMRAAEVDFILRVEKQAAAALEVT